MFMQHSVVSSDEEDFDCFIVNSSGNMYLTLEYPPFLNGFCGILFLLLVTNLLSCGYKHSVHTNYYSSEHYAEKKHTSLCYDLIRNETIIIRPEEIFYVTFH